MPILGTSPDAIDLAEDRERFQGLLHRLGLRQPANATAKDAAEALEKAQELGFPLVIRPSYVLGGRAMRIVARARRARGLRADAARASETGPVLLDRYLSDAIEIDVDVLADGETVRVAGVMQHVEEAGVHSGDSACSLPPYTLPPATVREVERQAVALAEALNVARPDERADGGQGRRGLHPRGQPARQPHRPVRRQGRSGAPIAQIAARVMAGERLRSTSACAEAPRHHVAVKEAVFPFARFPGVDLLLGPEMKSTGEVMGLDRDFAAAFIKSQLAAGTELPRGGTVFVSVRDSDKPAAVELARQLVEAGFSLVATRGTAAALGRGRACRSRR